MSPQETIAVFLRDFAREFVANRRADVVKQDLRNTEALLRSIKAIVNAQPDRGLYFMVVFANTYGRYQDMRRRYSKAGGREMIEALKDWAAAEGIGKFQKGRYAGQRANDSTERILGAIAWGTARKLKASSGTKKRGWWNRGKTRDIENFYDVLLRAYTESIALELKGNLNQA